MKPATNVASNWSVGLRSETATVKNAHNSQARTIELGPARSGRALGHPEDSCRAADSYLVARSFLKSYAGSQSTFNSFRTHVERLLLWALIMARKPLLDLRRSDAELFMEFCLPGLDRPHSQVSVQTHRWALFHQHLMVGAAHPAQRGRCRVDQCCASLVDILMRSP